MTRLLTVEATLDALSEIGKYLDDLSHAAGLGKQAAYNLRLAVDEIATNIIIHGYEEQGLSGRIILRADTTDDVVSVTLEDTGPAFDPRTRKMPTEEDLDKPLAERDIGGLGVFLAMKSVDEFRYERRGDVNLNTFIMRRGAKP